MASAIVIALVLKIVSVPLLVTAPLPSGSEVRGGGLAGADLQRARVDHGSAE
jgi:hypothetical protein